jgi:CRP-like cAMP-binding protein
LKVSEIESAGLRKRILNTLAAYFNTEFAADDSVLEELDVQELHGGEWLMQQGDPGDALYFLVRGRLQAWARDESGDNRGQFLNEIVPGDSVGELSLLTGAPRAVGIQAIRDSLLIRLDRAAFKRLARDHPALIMRLAANVASLLQSSNSGTRSSARNLNAITVLPLSASPRLENFCRELTLELENEGSTLSLSSGELGRKGAPVQSLQSGEAVPESLKNWLQDQENEYRFVVYHCSAGNTDWAQFALRHSDMVLLVGESSEDPAPQGWEQELLEKSGSTIARQLLVLLQPPSSEPIRNTAAWMANRKIDFHVQHCCVDGEPENRFSCSCSPRPARRSQPRHANSFGQCIGAGACRWRGPGIRAPGRSPRHAGTGPAGGLGGWHQYRRNHGGDHRQPHIGAGFNGTGQEIFRGRQTVQ